MRLFRPWQVFRKLYPEGVFRIKTSELLLWLTFDDGPDPASTPVILDTLAKCDVRAIFFCTGIKAEKYPDLVAKIRSAGHVIGNHGYSHLDGWKTGFKGYIDDIHKADDLTSSELFRPPYGRLTFGQYAALKKIYRIFFWDLMPYDFDPVFTGDDCINVLRSRIRPGSVIVLHDSPLSCAGRILEEFIEFTIKKGYKFCC